MENFIIKEKRTSIFTGILSMAILIFLVGGLTFALLHEKDVFTNSKDFWLFAFTVTILILAVKDAVCMFLLLLTKFISPYYIKVNNEGFFDCKLNQFIHWNKITAISCFNYKKDFYNKSTMIIYIISMILTTQAIPVIFDIFKSLIRSLGGGNSKIPVIITENKKELLKNASIFKKLENLLLPQNMIRLNIDDDLTNLEEYQRVISVLSSYKQQSYINNN